MGDCRKSKPGEGYALLWCAEKALKLILVKFVVLQNWFYSNQLQVSPFSSGFWNRLFNHQKDNGIRTLETVLKPMKTDTQGSCITSRLHITEGRVMGPESGWPQWILCAVQITSSLYLESCTINPKVGQVREAFHVVSGSLALLN